MVDIYDLKQLEALQHLVLAIRSNTGPGILVGCRQVVSTDWYTNYITEITICTCTLGQIECYCGILEKCLFRQVEFLIGCYKIYFIKITVGFEFPTVPVIKIVIACSMNQNVFLIVVLKVEIQLNEWSPNFRFVYPLTLCCLGPIMT